MKIVIVDPSRVVLKVLGATLENAGHEVVPCTDATVAIERLRNDSFVDVLVTSLQFDGMSGLQLTRQARLVAGSRRALYILVMSSSSERSTVVEALDSGADDFIGKPPAPDELLARLRVAGRLARLQSELIRLATIDALTGVLNRRAFFETAVLYSRCEMDAVAIFDIDRFKRINDTYGHGVGDAVITAVAHAASARCAMVGRLGGEEFGLLFPGGSVKDAVTTCEAVRLDVAALSFPDVDPQLRITCSFGAGEWRAGELMHEALKRADVALYAAKDGGRNRVMAATVAANDVANAASSPSAPERATPA
jgi:two-component system cell cycle response regulator